MFELFYISSVKNDLKNLSSEARDLIYNIHFQKLKDNPYQGKPLTTPFKGYSSYSFIHKGVEYRIIYRIKKKELIVLVIMIGSRENIYNMLKKRL
jgi:mRNA interferase RelE/StbE